MQYVAPHAGAWIETPSPAAINRPSSSVAPHAGAWIETDGKVGKYSSLKSHPMRVRGLKLYDRQVSVVMNVSHPIRVRGLKRNFGGGNRHQIVSHPMRVRWLKCKLLYSVGKSVLALHLR